MYNIGSNFNLFIMRMATRQGEYGHTSCTRLGTQLAHTVGQGSIFDMKVYYCGEILLTADILLYLLRVIYPNLETYNALT